MNTFFVTHGGNIENIESHKLTYCRTETKDLPYVNLRAYFNFGETDATFTGAAGD